MTYLLAKVEPVKWKEWRCSRCNFHIANYDECKPAHLSKQCPRCKQPNEMVWEGLGNRAA